MPWIGWAYCGRQILGNRIGGGCVKNSSYSQTGGVNKEIWSGSISKGKTSISEHLGHIHSSILLQLKYLATFIPTRLLWFTSHIPHRVRISHLGYSRNWLTTIGTGILPGVRTTSQQSNERICRVLKYPLFCVDRM